MKADCNKSPVDLLKQTFSALSSLPKEAPRSPTASGNNSPSLSKEKAAKEEDEFAKRFNFNVTNKQQIQDLFKKLLKYGDSYQTEVKSALEKSESQLLSNFTAQLFDIQNKSKEMREKAQKDIYDRKRNEEIIKSQRDIEALREESSKVESEIRNIQSSQLKIKEQTQYLAEEYNFIFNQLYSAKQGNDVLHQKYTQLKSTTSKTGRQYEERSAMLPPINSVTEVEPKENSEYFNEVFSKHQDILERLERKLYNAKRSNDSPIKKNKSVRDLIPYEQLFDLIASAEKEKVGKRKYASASALSKQKDHCPEKLSKADKIEIIESFLNQEEVKRIIYHGLFDKQ